MIKVHFHGVEVQIQHIPDNHMIVTINGTSTLIPLHEFQNYRDDVNYWLFEKSQKRTLILVRKTTHRKSSKVIRQSWKFKRK